MNVSIHNVVGIRIIPRKHDKYKQHAWINIHIICKDIHDNDHESTISLFLENLSDFNKIQFMELLSNKAEEK